MKKIQSHPKIDKSGNKYGALTVLSFNKYEIRKGSKTRRLFWNVKCECGTKKIIENSNLISNKKESCGCDRKKINAAGLSVLNDYKSSAKARNISFLLSNELFFELVSSNCFYCNSEPSLIKKRVIKNKNNDGDFIHNGIDRVNNKKGYTSDNCVPCCKICNFAKNKFNIEEFSNWIKNLSQYSEFINYDY